MNKYIPKVDMLYFIIKEFDQDKLFDCYPEKSYSQITCKTCWFEKRQRFDYPDRCDNSCPKQASKTSCRCILNLASNKCPVQGEEDAT